MADREADADLEVSVVIPFFDEEDNVDPLLDELQEVLPGLGRPYEVIAVDDGSRDRTRERLLARRSSFSALRVLSLRANRGQSAALACGFDHARAPIVLMMDGDMQNDPRDFARLLEVLLEVDGVSGIRAKRRDSGLRRLSSRIANAVRNRLSGDHVVDSASGIKGFRTPILRRIARFDGMHRFLPTLARIAGGRVREIPVHHRPRRAGRAKYGVWNRAWRAFVDLCGVRWLRRRRIDYNVVENGLDVDVAAPAGERTRAGPAA